jgi:putative transposase
MNIIHLMIWAIGACSDRRRSSIIDYLLEENRVLREQLGKKSRLSDDQCRRLAIKGRILGRKLLGQYACIVTPDTILRWYRTLVAKKWDTSDKRRPGRPRIRQVVVDHILRFKHDNHGWGSEKILGTLANVGYHISETTVRNVLFTHDLGSAE